MQWAHTMLTGSLLIIITYGEGQVVLHGLLLLLEIGLLCNDLVPRDIMFQHCKSGFGL
jgi:hypothetical protein